MRSDVISTMPRFGCSHVGKRAALTVSSDMFLDPNTIETSLWSSAGLGFSGHKKVAYMDALKSFAEKYIPKYEHEGQFVQCVDEDELTDITMKLDGTSSAVAHSTLRLCNN